ncbi:MAG: alpha-amylase, partial [Bacteroidota bacterium]
ATPYLFKRTLEEDQVLVGLDLNKGVKEITVYDTFKDGDQVKDFYSGTVAKVENGKIQIDSPYDIVLIEATE